MERILMNEYILEGLFSLGLPVSWYAFDISPDNLVKSVDDLLDINAQNNPGLPSNRELFKSFLISSLIKLRENDGTFSAIYQSWDDKEVVSINLSISTIATIPGKTMPIESISEIKTSEQKKTDIIKIPPVREIIDLPVGKSLEEKKLVAFNLSENEFIVHASTRYFIPAPGFLHVLTFSTPNLIKINKYYPTMCAIASTFKALN